MLAPVNTKKNRSGYFLNFIYTTKWSILLSSRIKSLHRTFYIQKQSRRSRRNGAFESDSDRNSERSN